MGFLDIRPTWCLCLIEFNVFRNSFIEPGICVVIVLIFRFFSFRYVRLKWVFIKWVLCRHFTIFWSIICNAFVFFEPDTFWSGFFFIVFIFFLCYLFFTRHRIVHPIYRDIVVVSIGFGILYWISHRSIWYLKILFCFGLVITFGCFWIRICISTSCLVFLRILMIFRIC